MRKVLSATSLLLLLLLAGCTSAVDSGSTTDSAPESSLAELQDSISSGSGCSDLFDQFSTISEDSPDFTSAQGEMRNVGCYSATSERSDAELHAAAPDSPWLGVTGTRVTVSGACATSVSAASRELDSTKADPLIVQSLDACASVDEWMSALEDDPGMMGMVDGYIPQLIDLQSACYGAESSTVCTDAAARGVLAQ